VFPVTIADGADLNRFESKSWIDTHRHLSHDDDDLCTPANSQTRSGGLETWLSGTPPQPNL